MDRSLYYELMRLLGPLARQIKLVATKAVLELTNDKTGLQMTQVSLYADEVTDDQVEHLQPGGVTHVPLRGAEGVYLTMGGVRDDGIVFGLSNREKRPKSRQPGETVLYSACEQASMIELKADGTVVITAPTKVVVNAPAVELGGSASAVARADYVERELNAIMTTLASLTGQARFSKTDETVGRVGASKGKSE
jgi:phage baseplate assembly protein V